MSGDSPNAFTNETVFDYKEGRSSPAPTTSKEHHDPGHVTASVLVEPPKEKKDKDHKDKEEEEPDFCSPILNPGADQHRRNSDGDKSAHVDDLKHDDRDKGKEDSNLLNGDPDKLPNPYTKPKEFDEEDSEEDTCIVNCIYYTMECCQCSIM